MLLTLPSFLLKQAVRSPVYLFNPPVVPQELVSLPRYSVIHHLDTRDNNHFISRDNYYFRNIADNKKIPIFHIADLLYKEDVTTLENKQFLGEIRKWTQANLQTFKSRDLLNQPNDDVNVVSVFNYNILKDMYKYKGSLLTKYYAYQNLYKTYYHYVKTAISLDKDSYHFITLDLPTSIPTFNVVNMLIKFSIAKFSRVVNDNNLMKVIDLYRWLSDETRSTSTLVDITDEEANRIMIEIRYKGHHTFVSLGLLRSMSTQSSLESKTKYKPEILSKIFMVFLSRLQDKVNGVLENIPTVEVSEQELPVEENSDQEETPQNNVSQIAPLSEVKGFMGLKKELKLDDIEKISSNIPTESLDDIVNAAIDKFQVDNQEVDEAYQRKIQQTSDDPEATAEPVFTVDYSEEKTQQALKPTTAEEKVQNYINAALTNKTLTSAEIRSLKKIHEQRKKLKSPYAETVSLDDYIQTKVDKELTKDKTKLDFTNSLVDDSFKSDIVGNFDKLYIKTTLKKDITACVAAIEKSGVMIKDYTVEEKKTATDRYEIHKLTLKPLDGKESTVFFRIPIIDSEGEMMGSSIRYKMRKMRTDLPIRKISPTKVAITSNYSKLFVFRTERKAFDPNAYLVDYLRKSYLNEENGVLKVVPGKKTLNEVVLPTDYYALATEFNEIKTDKATFLLNYKERHNYLDEKTLKDIDSQGLVFLGYLPNKNILVMDNKSVIFDYTNNMTVLGSVQELLEMDTTKVPKAFTMIKVLGDNISLGVVLSYYMGLSSLLSVTGVQYKLLESNKQYKPLKNELVLKFEDYKLILTLESTEQELLFNGFLYYKDYIKQHKLKDFDHKDIYLGVLEHRDAGLIHLKELGLLEDLFLDPITVDVLESMKEPTEFFKLLLRANELLKDFKHPDMNDPEYARIRGYDRVPGLMYRALAESIRTYKIKGRVNSKIELDPYKVWNYITQDSTVKITEDVNPIVDLKEMEAVTLSGMDGLSKDATPMGLRRYHKKDIGLISEGTVDSSDVALNTYLTPYAKFKDIRGTVDISNKDHVTNKAKAFSTSVLLAPMSENDDTKRINFLNIQNGHTIGIPGYVQPILRTGYEYVVPFKAGKLYAVMAEDDGQVIDKTDKLITVKYKDNTQKSYQIGTRYGRMEGSVYPHTLVTDLSVGQKVKKNDPIAYNQNFFEKDWLDPSRILMKFGRNVTVALTMNNEVFEDSSAISRELSKEMSTSVIKELIFVIDFNKNIVNLLPEGQQLEPNMPLFSVVDENTDYNNLSDSTINLLQTVASLTPKSKLYGTIDRFEIKYNGDISDMSPTLKKLAVKLDKQLYEETKGTEYETSNNQVNSEYRSEGKNLNPDTLELKIFVKVDLSMAVGDKGVFAGQMKTVLADVFTSNVTTESGTKVDAIFGYRGLLHRQVNSPVLMGTTNRLVKHVSKQVADIYFGK